MKPRKRMVHPQLFMSEDLAEASLAARYLFVGLWTLADREGRLRDKPKTIKAYTYPYENQPVDKLLDELHRGGHIVRYEVAGVKLIWVVQFLQYQSIHPKEEASILPPPTEEDRTYELKAKKSREKKLDIPYGQIHEDFCKTTGRNVILNEHRKGLIRGRWKEMTKKTREERLGLFRSVHRKKTAEWRDDPAMKNYLQPETLWAAKNFQKYVEQPEPEEDSFRKALER